MGVPMGNSLVPMGGAQSAPMPKRQPPMQQQPGQFPAEQMAPPQQAKPKPTGWKNALAGAADSFLQSYNPEGYKAGNDRRSHNALKQAMKDRNYAGASDNLYDLGEYQGGMEMAQKGDDAAQTAKMKPLQDALAFAQNIRNMEQGTRGEYLLANWHKFEGIVGMDFETFMQQNGGDLSNESLDQEIDGLRAQMGTAPPESDPYTLAPGAVRFKDGEQIANNPKVIDPKDVERKQAQDAYGRRRYLDTGEIVPGFDEVKPRNPGVVINTGDVGNGGRPIPSKPEAGHENYFENGRWHTRPMGGSDDERIAQSRITAMGGRDTGLDGLVNSYMTLDRNKAITSNDNTASENIGAMFSGTGVGKFIDGIGGEVGNQENLSARQAIDGLSMKALMDMISMSDVSAKAMDSDAEMKAWLGAIKSDNIEAALVKLHVLDTSFGSGDLLERNLLSGSIDAETYDRTFAMFGSDAKAQRLLSRAQVYASLQGGDSASPQRPADIPENVWNELSDEDKGLFIE